MQRGTKNDLHDDLRLLGSNLDSLPQVASLAIDLDALLQVLLLIDAAVFELV